MGTILYGRSGVIEAITQSYMVDSREIATIHPGHEIFVGIESMKKPMASILPYPSLYVYISVGRAV